MNVLKRAALAACLFLTCSSVNSAALTPANAFKDACRLSRYTCGFLRPPMVRISSQVESEEAYGIYFGGNTVWMNPVLTDPKKFYIVLVHEMVHYLQAHLDDAIPFGSQIKSCVYEEEAFEVSDIVAARLGQNDMIRPNILKAYGCA